MQFELYRKETIRIALSERDKIQDALNIIEIRGELSRLEQNGVLHSIQILTENAIGMAKHLLKRASRELPVSGYDCFKDLALLGIINKDDMQTWNSIIGLRNRIVHDYMSIDIEQIISLIVVRKHEFIIDFLTNCKA